MMLKQRLERPHERQGCSLTKFRAGGGLMARRLQVLAKQYKRTTHFCAHGAHGIREPENKSDAGKPRH